MNHHQYKRSLEKEINKLNKRIDQKILRGLSYRYESKRHKELSRQLKRLENKSSIKGLLASVYLF